MLTAEFPGNDHYKGDMHASKVYEYMCYEDCFAFLLNLLIGLDWSRRDGALEIVCNEKAKKKKILSIAIATDLQKKICKCFGGTITLFLHHHLTLQQLGYLVLLILSLGALGEKTGQEN